MSATPGAKVPSAAAAAAGFKAMGSRPEALLKALRQLQGVEGTPADQAFGISDVNTRLRRANAAQLDSTAVPRPHPHWSS